MNFDRRPYRMPMLLILLLSLAVAGPAASAEKADVILYNGKVFTSDTANLWAQAVAVKGHRIQAVGGNAEVLALARAGTRLLDLKGRVMIPGLNDAHVHALVPQGRQLNVPDFLPGPGPTVDDVLALIAQGAATSPPGTWLLATVGTNFSEDPRAQRFTLDQVAPNHPVKLELWTGHGMYFNTKGLRDLHIPENASDPFGGFYERFPGTGVLNGVVHEYAEHLVRRRFAERLTDAQIAGIYQNFVQAALSFGFTSVQEMSIGLPHERSVKILGQVNPAIRWRSICIPLTPDEPCHGGASSAPLVTPSGIKWIADGTPIERLAYMSEPYQDRPDTRGRFNFPADAFTHLVERSLFAPPRKSQLLLHLVGDAAIGALLDEMEELAPAAHWRQRRTRIEHGDLITPADVERVRNLGVVVVQNPTHLALPDIFQRYTPQVTANAQPLRSLVEAGVPLAFGTDGIGGSISPFLDLFLATLHPDRPSEALTLEQALIAYTAGSAYAEFEDGKKGQLVPGQLADLAVLSLDIFAAPSALPATHSELTMVDGRIVWDTGAVQAGQPLAP